MKKILLALALALFMFSNMNGEAGGLKSATFDVKGACSEFTLNNVSYTCKDQFRIFITQNDAFVFGSDYMRDDKTMVNFWITGNKFYNRDDSSNDYIVNGVLFKLDGAKKGQDMKASGVCNVTGPIDEKFFVECKIMLTDVGKSIYWKISGHKFDK